MRKKYIYIRIVGRLMSNQDVRIGSSLRKCCKFNEFTSTIIEGYEDNIRQWEATVMRSPAFD
ncbi:hypothetical protein [Coxiella-like endosymbiont]|uniref:hypothetical protein n=1 Tax=Coxiella-like endosymbiont TaxID=1592897 RepID=UPI002729C3A7|nr:hypothetical protein [Coxiella-like endosymbiont]